MPQTLQLEYACTREELREAQNLSLRKQLGGASKSRALMVLLVVLAIAVCLLGLFYFQVRNDVPERFRPYVPYGFCALFLGAFVFFHLKNSKHRESATNRVELTEQQMSFAVGNSRFTLPWSAFSDLIESPNLFVLVDRPKSTLIVLPKRAFPNENWQTWFRALVANRSPSQPSQLPTGTLLSTPGQVRLTFRLGFRDYFDRTLATAWTWLVIAGIAAFVLGMCLYEGTRPHPRAVYSGMQVYFMFMLPFTFAMAGMIVLIATVYPWYSHKNHLIPQEVILSPDSIGLASSDGVSVLPWSTFPRYRETHRSFILWNPRGRNWILLPKRAFTAPGDLQRCRGLFAQHLRNSFWYSGDWSLLASAR